MRTRLVWIRTYPHIHVSKQKQMHHPTYIYASMHLPFLLKNCPNSCRRHQTLTLSQINTKNNRTSCMYGLRCSLTNLFPKWHQHWCASRLQMLLEMIDAQNGFHLLSGLTFLQTSDVTCTESVIKYLIYSATADKWVSKMGTPLTVIISSVHRHFPSPNPLCRLKVH